MKNRSIAGETIVESLVGMLIISLVFVFLVNAVLVSAHINSNVKNADVSYDLDNPLPLGSMAVLVDGNMVDVDVYEASAQSGNTRYYYYERHES